MTHEVAHESRAGGESLPTVIVALGATAIADELQRCFAAAKLQVMKD